MARIKETDLSDANQDGKVDEEDLDRIQQIIKGTESEIYYIDAFGNASRVKHPLERIVLVYDNTAEIIRILGAEERVVGVGFRGSSVPLENIPPTFPSSSRPLPSATETISGIYRSVPECRLRSKGAWSIRLSSDELDAARRLFPDLMSVKCNN